MAVQAAIARDYRPHAKQLAFHRSTARFVAVAAGVRGGKTLSATIEFLCRIYRDVAAGKSKKKVQGGAGRFRVPSLLYWVVAPTFELTEFVRRYILEFAPDLIEHVSGTDGSIWLRGNILVQFKSTERPERLVGASVNGMLIDEACRCKPEAWKGSLRGRLADTQGWAIFTSSPLGGKTNWLYQEVVTKGGTDGYDSYHWTTADNTAVPELLIDVENARRTMAPQFFKREYEASWDSFGGTIYEEVSDDNLITEAAFRMRFGLGQQPFTADVARRLFRRVVCGVDWGWTSPGAMVVIGDLGETLVVLEESYASMRPILGNGTTWLSEARRLRDRWGVSMFVCDPARPDATNDLSTNGVPAIGGYNDIYLGIRRVSEAVHIANGRPGMLVMSDCVHTIAEMRSYQWASNRDQSGFTELPAQGQSDHAVDALRYGTVEMRPYSIEKKNSNPFGFGMPGKSVLT